jgi:H+/gluconate symporter-like permease
LYSRLFSFAQVRRLEHHSPLLLETVAVIGVAVALPAILLYGCMWAVYYARRADAEIRIRETEAELKQEELKQSRLRSQVQEDMANAIRIAGFSPEPLRISEAALAETARVITPTVSELGKSPLIGSVTIGLSKGK